jgi:hypothetical protein
MTKFKFSLLFSLPLVVFFCFFPKVIFADTTSSISQYGITWTFDRAYEYGQFANGDYWVLGPVVINNITPDFDGEKNGWQVNPVPSSTQGFSIEAYYPYVGRGVNFDDSLVPGLPYTAQPGESIVKASSSSIVADNGALESAAVLTILGSIPPDNGATIFRPLM